MHLIILKCIQETKIPWIMFSLNKKISNNATIMQRDCCSLATVSLQYNIFNEMFQTLQAHVKILLNCHQIFLVEFTRECTMYLRLEHLYLAVGSIEMHDLS